MNHTSSHYFFVLGTHPELALAEIMAASERHNISLQLQQRLGSVALFTASTDIPADFFFSLGGSIKYGLISREIRVQQFSADIVFSLLQEFFPEISDKKLLFGVSVYSDHPESVNRLQKKVYMAALHSKKKLRLAGRKVRLVTSKEQVLSSVVVHKNSLDDPKRGCEIVIVVGREKIFLGVTRAVQDFEQFGLYDYGRPARDTRSGLLPPKVARCMIHLSQVKPDQYLLDPFCGSGTIIQEALRLKHGLLAATDKSHKAMQDTEKNLHWFSQSAGVSLDLSRNFSVPGESDAASSAAVFLRTVSVATIGDVLPRQGIGVIVTEPYLGPPELGTGRSVASLPAIITDLERLYLQAFRSFQHVLLPGGRVVMIWPVFFQANTFHYLKIVTEVQKLGFSLQRFPSFIKTNQRGALEYGRPGQLVKREIWVFCRNMV